MMHVDQAHNQTTAQLAISSFVPLLSGAFAAAVACGVPLVQGVAAGWPLVKSVAYALVALCFLGLMLLPGASWPAARRLSETHWAFLLLGGLLGVALQAISGDPFMQPIVFAVVFVHAALLFDGAVGPSLTSGVCYLGLIALGQVLHGWRSFEQVVVPVVAYLAPFGFLYAFTGLSITQGKARLRADVLAADLARERDYLARLVGVGAALTRDLDLGAVLREVAAAGSALAGAEQVRVWLHSHDDQGQQTLRLAASNPQGLPTTLDPGDEGDLLAVEARNAGTSLVLPLLFGGENIGALELRQRHEGLFTNQDTARLQPFANTAAIAIRNAQLYEQSRRSATLEERNRLARELHDTIAQGLTAITMQLEAAQRGFERDPERARGRVTRAAELSRAALHDVRRSVWALAAPLAEGATLREALAEQCAAFAERTGITTEYEHHGPPAQLEDAPRNQILRIVQEALHNIEKHAHARSVTVTSYCDSDGFRLTVVDDGVGFDPNATTARGDGGFGLISLRERARLAGGELLIDSQPGRGTCVAVEIMKSMG